MFFAARNQIKKATSKDSLRLSSKDEVLSQHDQRRRGSRIIAKFVNIERCKT
jgi:hypothetical protein